MNTLNSFLIKKEYMSLYVNEIAEKLQKQPNYARKKYQNLLKELIKTKQRYEDYLRENFYIEKTLEIIRAGDSVNKSLKEYHLISRLLETTDLKRFINEQMEEIVKSRLIYYCAMNLIYIFVEKGQNIINEGDPGDCFFVILKGKVKILKSAEKTMSVNGEEYSNLLINLLSNKYIDKVYKTIEANKSIFPFNLSHINFIKEITFLVKLRRLIDFGSSKILILDLFKTFSINPLQFFSDLGLIDNDNKNKIVIFRKAFKLIKEDLIGEHEINFKLYKFMTDDKEYKNVTIYHNTTILSMSTGRIFGEASLNDTNGVRNSTVQAEEDSHIGVISAKLYREYMLIERQKLITNEINFLLENFFFKSFTVNFFRKKFFYDFVFTEYNKGHTLFKEKEQADYLYFIVDGEIELKIESTVLELGEIIKNFLNLTNLNKQYKDYESDFLIKNYNKLNDKINSKKVFKICLFARKEVLGMESFYLKIPMFYSATVISDSAKCYVIESKKVDKIINSEKDTLFAFNQKVTSKFHMISKRLIEIKIGAINLIEKSFEKSTFSPKRTLENLPSNDSCPLINRTSFIKPEQYLTSLSSSKNLANLNSNIVSSKFTINKLKDNSKYSRNKQTAVLSSFSTISNQQDLKDIKPKKLFENFQFPTININNQITHNQNKKLKEMIISLPENNNLVDYPRKMIESPIMKKIIIVDKNERKNFHKKTGGNEIKAKFGNILELKNDDLKSIVNESDFMNKFKHLFIIKKKHKSLDFD